LLPAITLIPYVLLAMTGQASYGRTWASMPGQSGELSGMARLFLASFFQLCLSSACGYFLHRNLTQRRFALENSREI
jgi:hypothetical protein